MLGVLVLAGGAASASAAPTAADRSATHAYLIASETRYEAQLANAPQSTAAKEATATRIARECPGVLAGAPPPEEKGRPFRLGSQTEPSARTRGEHRRERRQRAALQVELSVAMSDSRDAPEREATEVFIRAIGPLRWSSPLITGFVHLLASELQGELGIPTPAVCVDMSSWVASGYKTLTPASKALSAQTETLVKQAFEIVAVALSAHLQTFPNFLAGYENASDRVLARHAETLATQLKTARESQAPLKQLEATVGLPIAKPPSVKPPVEKKPVVIDRGRTAAGGNFVARAALPVHRFRGMRCTTEVSIEEPSHPGNGGLFGILSGESPERCLSRSHVEPRPSVHCNSGLLTVEAGLRPDAFSVRLRLSDNRTITSQAIRVPARLGGPAGLYYQVVHGPSPIPVSVTELDAHGNTLTVLKLPAVVECTKQLVKYLPGGNVRLAHGSVPQGPTFTIRAEHYRELGHVHFELKFSVSTEEEGLFGFGSGGGGAFEAEASRPRGRQAFEAQASTGCKPQPYAIVYGLLSAPRDTVLARVSGNLVPLLNVAIPARMHAGGVLAYGVFSPLPTELVTRNARGRIVSTDNLGATAKSTTETCEGEAEG